MITLHPTFDSLPPHLSPPSITPVPTAIRSTILSTWTAATSCLLSQAEIREKRERRAAQQRALIQATVNAPINQMTSSTNMHTESSTGISTSIPAAAATATATGSRRLPPPLQLPGYLYDPSTNKYYKRPSRHAPTPALDVLINHTHQGEDEDEDESGMEHKDGIFRHDVDANAGSRRTWRGGTQRRHGMDASRWESSNGMMNGRDSHIRIMLRKGEKCERTQVRLGHTHEQPFQRSASMNAPQQLQAGSSISLHRMRTLDRTLNINLHLHQRQSFSLLSFLYQHSSRSTMPHAASSLPTIAEPR